MVFTEAELKDLKKDHLIKIILEQEKTIAELKSINQKLQELENKIEEIQSVSLVRENASTLLFRKVKYLESELLKSQQYSRRECLDISGIKDDVSDTDLEGKVVELLSGVGVALEADKDIQACHRYGRKKTVIVKFTNRKTVHKILSVKTELPDNVFVNETLCPRNKYIWGRCSYLRKQGMLAKVGVRNGMVRVKKAANDHYIDIMHEDDIIDMFPDYEFPF